MPDTIYQTDGAGGSRKNINRQVFTPYDHCRDRPQPAAGRFDCVCPGNPRPCQAGLIDAALTERKDATIRKIFTLAALATIVVLMLIQFGPAVVF
ncbi:MULTISPECIES: hypothetical protein [Bradyrhizobium]|uniref:hypothetical protein n=1 Tax=Bradyrhizobium TaxID=374 RepID=UPI00155E7F8C|nr:MULTISPECIES: hypothetical protein [Bradyrhizobium]UUO32336.1 hypothetical protein DCG74_36905 [Bradyrhizobium sp. WBAH42]